MSGDLVPQWDTRGSSERLVITLALVAILLCLLAILCEVRGLRDDLERAQANPHCLEVTP